MEKSKFKNYIFIILFYVLVAVLGSVFVGIGNLWYSRLFLPMQWVPNVVIPIVWTVLYILLAVCGCYLYGKGTLSKPTLILAIINGILNVLWCLIFFTLRQKLLGNIVIILNLIAGFFLVHSIYKSNKVWGIILLLYPIWLSIATTLNTAIWILN